ncbi:DinB family protein [Streptomyces albidoflavus]|uniref:DinB family protein n=1 Tax=Streptomyces albidoflavus TaxID=1886 RepID=UPI00189F5994|nr:DinB family protein [Streptomyces albidoflavus]
MAATTTTTPTPLDAERADLIGALASVRGALTASVAGLGDEEAGQRPTVSALCLGGLVKHVTAVEETWARFMVEGTSALRFDLPDGVTWADLAAGTARELPRWMTEREDEFRMLPGETLAGVVERYEEVAGRTDAVIASVPDLSTTYAMPDVPWQEPGEVRSVRRVIAHVIAETAQHAGHADILRETLDGRTSS